MAKYKAGITEKRLKNRRFRKTEEAILKVFFERDAYISLEEMANKAGVTRSTVYYHHRAVRGIVLDYERYIFRKYSILLSKMPKKRVLRVKIFYKQVLIFIIRHKVVFRILLRGGGTDIFVKMIDKVKPDLIKYAKLPKNADKVFLVYKNEVGSLLAEWGKEDFREDSMETVLKDIMYLTDTMRLRLKELLKN